MTTVDIVIRDIDGPVEMRAAENIQKEVWGLPGLDVVPVTQFVAAKAAGGILLGAFDGNTLVGFVYGFVGLEDGRMTHHSHMLAVKPAYREHSLGHKLKIAQRECALAQGISEMTWTFDPLQGLNAYFNFGRLGVISDKYLIDFYGSDAASFLHRNGTDRLWVTWPLNSRRVAGRIERSLLPENVEEMRAAVEVGKSNEPILNEIIRSDGGTISIEIPLRIADVESSSPELAVQWRGVTRNAFVSAIDQGFVVFDFIRGTDTGRYLMKRKNDIAFLTE